MPSTPIDDLPNLPLLIKLLKLTTSSNDQEALMAVRKANEQLAKFGGDWEKLLRGKVTVISDPFVNVAPPSAHEINRGGREPNIPQPPRPPQYPRTTPPLRTTLYPQSTVRVKRARAPRSTGLDSLV